MAGSLISGALFDPTRRYRYRLWRVWNASRPRVAFVLLNPSTADETQDDPTIRRCIGFARRWGFGAVEILNLFAFRATRPADLRRAAEPAGPRNDHHLRQAPRRNDLIVLGWGNHGAWRQRDRHVELLLGRGGPLFCLGRTQAGSPRHPLYLSSATPLARFELTR